MTPQVRDAQGNVVDGTPTETEVKDGKTYAPVITKGQDGVSTIKFYPVDPKTGQADQTKDPVATGEVKDGAKGDKGEKGDPGEKGQDGKNGENGKTFAPVVTKGADGTTSIKFYPVNPETGKADESQPAVAEGTVKDGQDGKTFTPVVEKGQDGTTTIKFYPTGKDGQADKTKDPVASGEVKDGADGKTFTPVVEKGQDGVTTIKFYPTDPKTGEPDKTKAPVATGEVKDGKSPVVETTRVEDADPTTPGNQAGTKVVVKDPETGNVISESFVKDGEKGQDGAKGEKGDPGQDGKTFVPVVEKGQDGTTTIKFYPAGKDGQADKTKDPVASGEVKDGADGKTFTPVVEKGQDGVTTIKFYPTDPKTGEPDKTKAPVATGEVKDGKSPVVETTRVEDADPTTEGNQPGTKVTVKDPETNKVISESFVKDGANGQDGQSYAPVVKKGEDGTTSIKFYPVDPKTGQPDTTKPAVAEGTVKDGINGKSAYTTVVEGPNAAGEPGQWIINYFDKNGDGKFTDDEIVSTQFVRNGKDGKDGKDGKTFAPVVEKGADGTTSIKFYPVNPETGKADQTQPAVAEGTVKDGQDGKTFAPVLEKGKDGETTIKFYPVNPETKQPDMTQAPVAEGKVKDGKDGKDGLSPKVETRRNDANDGVIIKVTPQVRDAEGNVVDGTPSETEVKDGKNGKTFAPVVTKGQDGTTSIKFYPVNPETGKADTEQPAVAEGTVKDGTDGKTFAPVVEKGADGTTTIKFYPVDPKTGEADTTKPAVAEGAVKDGANGKSAYTTVVEGPNAANEPGRWIINYFDKNGDGKFTDDEVVSAQFVRDGKDGQSPTVEVKDNGDGTHTITTKNPDGTVNSTTTVKNGKDGKSPVVESTRVEDADPNTPDNQPGTKITVKDPETGKVISETFVKDGVNGKDGKDGKNGIDGKSFAPVVEKGQDGTTTIKFYPVDPKTGKADTTQAPVAEGTVKDGKSAYTTVVEGPNAAGEPGRWIINYYDKNADGKFTDDEVVSAQFIPDGKDGKTYAPVVTKGEDGTTTIKFYPVDPKTGKADESQPAVAEGSVKDGKDAKAPVVETERVEDLDPNTPGNQAGTKITVKDPENDKVISETFVKDGQDGKSPEVTTKDNGNGTHTITIKNPDGTTTTTTVKDGAKGEKGDKGQDGTNGVDGKTFAPVVEKGADGTTTIKFYPVDPKTGKVDKSQEPVATGEVKDGAQGAAGQDGKSAYTTVVTGPNEAGEQGQWIINYYDKNGDGKFTDDEVVSAKFVRDGKDGKSPEVTTKDNGNGTHTITIKNPDGTTTTTTVKDGKAGQNGKDGRDGKDGIDGKTFAPVLEKGQDGTTTIKFYPVDPKTGQPDTTQPAVAEGSVKDGKDGKSPEVSLKDNGDGTHTITVKNPDGTTSTTTVKNGQDGKSPEVTTTDNGDGTHTITIKNPDGTTTTTTVKDGKDGRDGIDGKTFAPVVEKGQDGTTTIKFYPVDPKTGQPDTTQPAVAEGSVKDGRDGKDGKDGKSPQVSIRNNNDGSHTITIKNPDGTTTNTTVRDGKDGKSPEVSVKDNGDGSHTITIKNPDGTTTTTTVKDGKDGRDGKDGKDGQSQRIRTEKGKDSQGNEGVWVIITDDKGNELSREFIRDGKTPSVKVEEGKNSRGESGQWIIVFDGDGNEVSREFVRDGKDGASSSLETIPGKNEKGESGLWVIVKDGQGNESSRHFVRDGKDGKDGKDGRSVQKIYNRQGKLIIIFSDHTTEEIEIPCCKPCPESPRTPKPGDPTPKVPNKPETPKPGEPKVPGNPTPEVPGQPGNPTPEVPNVPGEPTPEVPNVPGDPTPEVPNVPGEPTPEVPNVPGDPTPEVPNVPGEPAPGVPSVPDNPTPEVPNEPAEPRPEVPNQPSDPAPQVPGQADPDNSFKAKDNESATNKEQDGQNKQVSLPATGAEVTSAMTVIIASLLLSSGALLVKNNKED
ncbi:collagen-flanked surface repeat-containing protein [Aerococcus tenax]|uniref:collagen-flanked surface repeat-containing protein n=1 Tax=Aerococcus tenax TaxID=3078812 RepID=UPI0018E1B24A|nr:LPXTG cell wall anchor domain-containing protein [Aerococcus tenax]